MAGYVYILCNKPYGTLYTGVTSQMSPRLHAHRIGKASAFTKKYGLKTLVWYEEHPTIQQAIQRETSIKRWKRDWKIELIEKTNPDWRDLADTLI